MARAEEAASRALERGVTVDVAAGRHLGLHLPCGDRHRGFGPDSVLRALRAAGFRVTVLAEPACCGAAEPFRVAAPDVAAALGVAAVRAWAALDLDVIASPDSACRDAVAAALGTPDPRVVDLVALLDGLGVAGA